MDKHRSVASLTAVITGLLLVLTASGPAGAGDSAIAIKGKIALIKAVMCEEIQGSSPQNSTTVFSIERRKAICFTSFDPVREKTVIYHRWLHRERPSAKIKLTLKPPRWSAYSSIQFRVEDIGPWRVEIVDSQGNVLDVLRFSITE